MLCLSCYKSLSDLHSSADEPPTIPETPAMQDSAKDDPEIPLTPSCEEPPEIPTNPEPNKVPKVTRRASAALDKAQKRGRRLSVPVNFLSFLTRRKSGIWNDDMRNQGTQEQQEVIVNQSEGESETSPQETEDKGTENEEKHEAVKDGSDQSSDIPDGKTEEKPIPENDMECKDIDANSHKDEEMQQKEDLSEQETLQDTEVKDSPNADQSKDEQTFWRCLSGPVEKEDQLGVADLQNVLINTLCLETGHLNRKPETKERCLYDYLDLAGHETASKVSSTVELIRKPVVEVCIPDSVEKTSEERTGGVMQEDSREDGGEQVDPKEEEEEEQKILEDGSKHEEEADVRKDITEDSDTVKDQDFENAEQTELRADLTSEETAQTQNQEEAELKEETERDEPSEAELKKEETPAEKESRHEASPEEIHSSENRDATEDVTTGQSDELRNEAGSQNDPLINDTVNDTVETSELQTDSPACSETQSEDVSSEKSKGVSLDKKVPQTTKQVSFAHANELVESTEKSHSVLNGNSNAEAPHTESNGSLHHNINQHNDESGLSTKNELVSQYCQKSFLPTQHNISF